MTDAPTTSELIARASSHGPETVHSMRQLVSLHDGEFSEWRNWEFWAQLARRWRERAPKERTREQAREHYRRVVRALGIRRSQ